MKINFDKINYFENNVYHQSAGGIVFYISKKSLKVALLKLVDNGWTILKGHLKKSETAFQCALREIKEELGVKQNLNLINRIGTDNYKFKLPNDKRNHFKKVEIFLFTLDQEVPLKPQYKEKFVKAKWFSVDEARKKIFPSIFIESRFFEINGKVIKGNEIDKKILLEARRMVVNFYNSPKLSIPRKKIYIQGKVRLEGSVELSGSKHAVIPIIISSLLTKEEIILKNVPRIRDVFILCECLKILGGRVIFDNNMLFIKMTRCKNVGLPSHLIKQMRGTLLFLPALLIRKGFVKLYAVKGDPIGKCPVSNYTEVLIKMGASIKIDNREFIKATAKKFFSAKIILNEKKPSPGATKSILIVAVTTPGQTIIINASRLPEVVDFIRFLKTLGAKISGEGTEKIIINGVKLLHGGKFEIPPDRIELVTIITAVGATNGKVIIKNAVPLLTLIKPEFKKFLEAGIRFSYKNNNLTAEGNKKIKGIFIETDIYPQFNTDSQPILAPLLCIAKGKSMIKERMFEKRFEYAKELIKMGANIKFNNNQSVLIKGHSQLHGTDVEAKDIRGAAALVIAGLIAHGITGIKNSYWLDRGYDNFDIKLIMLGAKIWRK